MFHSFTLNRLKLKAMSLSVVSFLNINLILLLVFIFFFIFVWYSQISKGLVENIFVVSLIVLLGHMYLSFVFLLDTVFSKVDIVEGVVFKYDSSLDNSDSPSFLKIEDIEFDSASSDSRFFRKMVNGKKAKVHFLRFSKIIVDLGESE